MKDDKGMPEGLFPDVIRILEEFFGAEVVVFEPVEGGVLVCLKTGKEELDWLKDFLQRAGAQADEIAIYLSSSSLKDGEAPGEGREEG